MGLGVVRSGYGWLRSLRASINYARRRPAGVEFFTERDRRDPCQSRLSLCDENDSQAVPYPCPHGIPGRDCDCEDLWIERPVLRSPAVATPRRVVCARELPALVAEARRPNEYPRAFDGVVTEAIEVDGFVAVQCRVGGDGATGLVIDADESVELT